MSLRVGLGASQADLDVQGEIDFDFFEESDCNSESKHSDSQSHVSKQEPLPLNQVTATDNNEASFQNNLVHLRYNNDLNPNRQFPESLSSHDFNKPVITISCDDVTGVMQKTIETVIPTPFNYTDNKCGRASPSINKKAKSGSSPQMKKKNLSHEENEPSDDSSVSSMSDSESNLSSVSEDSFELEDTDSMTDVSPLASPYCHTPPTKNGSDPQAISPMHGRDFKRDDAKKKLCLNCESLDYNELVNAMNRIDMKPRPCSSKCKSPILTHNSEIRQNMSFRNEEVRKIDHDNRLLLKKIEAQQNRTKSTHIPFAQVKSSSSVNRQKVQRQIDLENMALLKRLESTKPSKTLSRTHLLRDYNKRTSGLLSSRSTSRSSYSGHSSSHNSVRHSARSSAISLKSPLNHTSAYQRMNFSATTLQSN